MSTVKPPSPAPQLVEILDPGRRVVALLPAAEAARQKLRHRTVAVLLFDEAGRVLLRRRAAGPDGRPGRWDVPVRGAVLAGEALSDAASRCLETVLGIRSERLRPLLELPAEPENSNEFLHVFGLVRADAASAHQECDPGDYSFAPEELDCLLRDFRELVSPRFRLLAEAMSVRGLWRRRGRP